jgi:coenzyme F420-reducing hydrogenase delta subunit
MEQFEPKIIAFVCNWCTYAGADLAGTSRLKYASNVKIIRFPCTGRIDFMLLQKAFANGADGIIVSGCHPNDCHYTSGNYHARRRWTVYKELLDFTGIDTRRITFTWVSAAEGGKWAEVVNSTVETIRQLGPYSDMQELTEASMIDLMSAFTAEPMPEPMPKSTPESLQEPAEKHQPNESR